MNKKPFFTKFLENQMSEKSASSVKGGGGDYQTLKYPSDSEDPGPVTLKYPSDNEDGPGGSTKPALDQAVTLKHPSDSDEAGDLA